MKNGTLVSASEADFARSGNFAASGSGFQRKGRTLTTGEKNNKKMKRPGTQGGTVKAGKSMKVKRKLFNGSKQNPHDQLASMMFYNPSLMYTAGPQRDQ